MSTPALNPLVTKIRSMHPGSYDDMDDASLTKAVLRKYPQYSDLADPPAAGPHINMQEMNIFDPGDAGEPSKGVAPAGKLTGLPGVNPHVPSYKEGSSDVMLAGAPLAAIASPGQIVRGAIGAAIGGPVAKSGAEAAGLGKTGQELSETGGQLVGGGLGAGAPEIAASRPGRTIAALAKPAGVAAEDLPVVGSAIKGAKALWDVPGKIGEIWKKPPVPAVPTPAPPAKLPAAFDPLPPKAPPVPGTADAPFQRGAIASSMAEPAPPAPAPTFQRGQLQNLLNKSLDAAPPLDPKAPIYQRGQIAQRVKSAPSEDLTPVLQKSLDQVNASKAADVSEGHTPVTSSAMKSYKYDPAAREFHARMTSGDTTYVYGDVSPEDAQAFETAESKGKALPQIKRNPLVAKIVNGKRIAVKPSN